jgi:hypothetical protein
MTARGALTTLTFSKTMSSTFMIEEEKRRRRKKIIIIIIIIIIISGWRVSLLADPAAYTPTHTLDSISQE